MLMGKKLRSFTEGHKERSQSMGGALPWGRFRAIKMSALPKAIYKLDVTAVKMSKGTLNRMGQADSQVNLEGEKIQS